MSAEAPAPRYTLYHPRWYRRRVSVWWWLQNPTYTGFVLRELSSVFVAFFAVVFLWQLRALVRGPEAYAQVLARLGTPLFLLLHAVTFLFVLIHAVTWFNLAPRAMVVRVRGRRLPDWVIVGSNYAAWLVASAVVAVILLRG
ncbi:MAG TPA: fumarate reductase subunit C [Methylomirabilota bacterium]|jgi:fumarate reductase subunit C|nr:fumarate reductase subunit C [Methylomirabilota bacterium]